MFVSFAGFVLKVEVFLFLSSLAGQQVQYSCGHAQFSTTTRPQEACFPFFFPSFMNSFRTVTPALVYNTSPIQTSSSSIIFPSSCAPSATENELSLHAILHPSLSGGCCGGNRCLQGGVGEALGGLKGKNQLKPSVSTGFY